MKIDYRLCVNKKCTNSERKYCIIYKECDKYIPEKPPGETRKVLNIIFSILAILMFIVGSISLVRYLTYNHFIDLSTLLWSNQVVIILMLLRGKKNE